MRPPRKAEANRFFSIAQLAERWQVSPRTVRRLIDRRELPVTRIGTAVRIAEADLVTFERLRRDG